MEFLWYAVAGVLGGVLGGMGMGGGTVLVPLLSIFYAVEQHTAPGGQFDRLYTDGGRRDHHTHKEWTFGF